MPTNVQLETQVAELRSQVEALTNEATAAREAARQVVNPVSPYAAAAAANKRERDAHDAWKRKMGYGVPASPQVQLENSGDAYERQVAAALKAERDQKAAGEALRRKNAARRAALVESGEYAETDQFQRAQSSAARQREIEAERLARDTDTERTS